MRRCFCFTTFGLAIVLTLFLLVPGVALGVPWPVSYGPPTIAPIGASPGTSPAATSTTTAFPT